MFLIFYNSILWRSSNKIFEQFIIEYISETKLIDSTFYIFLNFSNTYIHSEYNYCCSSIKIKKIWKVELINCLETQL